MEPQTTTFQLFHLTSQQSFARWIKGFVANQILMSITREMARNKFKQETSPEIYFWMVATYSYLLNFVRNFTLGATQILMLIAVEVGTKSKWAISPELYFQTAPVGQTSTSSKHIFALFEIARKVTLQKKESMYTSIKLHFLSVKYKT